MEISFHHQRIYAYHFCVVYQTEKLFATGGKLIPENVWLLLLCLHSILSRNSLKLFSEVSVSSW